MPRIAIPVASEFEDSELTVPVERFKSEGYDVTLIGLERGAIAVGKRGKAKVKIDRSAREVSPEQFDALVIPGGHSPDHLRTDEDVVSFVREFCESEKPVAAICHGPQLLIEADAVKGRTLTSWPSVRKDLQNAGARWVDQRVVVDDNMITSRKPEDLDAFCNAILEALSVSNAQAASAGS